MDGSLEPEVEYYTTFPVLESPSFDCYYLKNFRLDFSIFRFHRRDVIGGLVHYHGNLKVPEIKPEVKFEGGDISGNVSGSGQFSEGTGVITAGGTVAGPIACAGQCAGAVTTAAVGAVEGGVEVVAFEGAFEGTVDGTCEQEVTLEGTCDCTSSLEGTIETLAGSIAFTGQLDGGHYTGPGCSVKIPSYDVAVSDVSSSVDCSIDAWRNGMAGMLALVVVDSAFEDYGSLIDTYGELHGCEVLGYVEVTFKGSKPLKIRDYTLCNHSKIIGIFWTFPQFLNDGVSWRSDWSYLIKRKNHYLLCVVEIVAYVLAKNGQTRHVVIAKPLLLLLMQRRPLSS
jgi:hypothetical protein